MESDNQSQNSKRDLPNTPRVCGKILDYYHKFGQERDLEKFMRLYSPASSQGSEKAQGSDCASTRTSVYKRTKSRETISSNKSCEILTIMTSSPLSVCCEATSKSLPNIDIQGQGFERNLYVASNDITVDINIQTDGEKEKILGTSRENVKTPKKAFRSTKTQTPESVAKTHRRLEWDSLGDVGYEKSVSTSNISTTERSLLREYFKEKSTVSEPSAPARKEKRNLEHKQSKTVEKLKAADKELSTPPLACSTLMNPVENGAKPKMLSRSTSSTSLTEKFEKYAQTSFIKPPTVRSQQVQCTLSSSYSIAGGTATPSSFEYYSSSKSKSSKSSDIMLNANIRDRLKAQEHPFITSITDLLMKRKTLGEKNQQNRQQLINVKDLQTKFQSALDENKENQTYATIDSSSATTFSLSKQAPELDLGIQLICSLIDAKSVNGRQKKQLIRDIIKRLTRIEGEEKSETPTTANSSKGTVNSSASATTNSSNFHQQSLYDSVLSGVKENKQRNIIKSFELGVSPLNAEEMNTKEKSTASISNTIEDYNNVLAAKQPENQPLPRARKVHEFCASRQPDKIIKNDTQKNIKVSSASAAKINKETQSECIMMQQQNTYASKQMATHRKLTPEALQKKCLKSNRCTQTSLTSMCTTSTTTPPDLTTQKLETSANHELNNSNTDAEQPTMQEWLKPLTQSEIEFEEKKQIEIKKKVAAQQAKLSKKAKHDSGRVQQLSWIENEIKRLECLKHLLLKDETVSRNSNNASSVDNSHHKSPNKNSYQTDKLYDTVYTDKSSVLSESAEQLVQEIEIILEESQEDIINFKNNTKHSKERKKETQLIYEKEKNSLKTSKTKPKLRIINENTNIHEEQLFKYKLPETSNNIPKQREKIDTPSTDTSKGCETLKDMVQQRKREFMEAYKSKKQHHYHALKQQQKDFKYLNLAQELSGKSTTTTDSEHYSVPHTMPRKYTSNKVSYYTQQPTHVAPTEQQAEHKHASQEQNSEPHIKETMISKSTQAENFTTNSSSSIFCMSSEISVPMGSQIKESIISKPAQAENSTTTSLSSIFCMSSEISVPMGSQNTTSPPSSSHLYNSKVKVAGKTGVAVQTSDSIKLSKPIYGPAPPQLTLAPHNPTKFSSTACVKVKPKGIAYVIEFDDNKQAEADTNSNDALTKPSTKSDNSSTNPGTASDLKSSQPNEQLLTLQEHLEKSKPKFLKHSKERKAILNQLKAMRQERVRQLREIIEDTSMNSLDRRLKYLPPPPIQKVRILKTREMKALTNKRFASLPEVVAKQEREIEARQRRSNRILRDVFNKRLQKRVRSGKLSLNHSKTVV